MEWERAKNYLIVFFLLLNIALGFLLFTENRRYTMAGEQERLIRRVLSQNNISIYWMPMRHFPPMRPLNVTGYYYDVEALLHIFFPNPEDVERQERFGRQVFLYNDSWMEIINGFVSFETPNGFRQDYDDAAIDAVYQELTDGNVTRLTDIFINSHFPDFVPDSIVQLYNSENIRVGVRIIYRQEYRGMLIHSNFIEFLVTSVGIQEIEMEFGQVLGHTGSPRVIFSPYEALLAFTQRVSHITQDRPMFIEHMDLVYFLEYFSDQPGPYHAVPFYRIFTRCEGERPFLINAFTNMSID